MKIFLYFFLLGNKTWKQERSYYNMSNTECREYIVRNLNELEYESLEDAKVACDNINNENQECNMIQHVDRRCNAKSEDWSERYPGLEYRWTGKAMGWVKPRYKLCKTTSKLISWPYACLHIAGQ